MFLRALATGLSLALLPLSMPAHAAGKLVLLGDDWMLSNDAFENNTDEAENLADTLDSYLGANRYAIFSDYAIPYGTDLVGHVTDRGDTIDTITGIGSIGAYDTVLVSGRAGRADDAGNLSIWQNYLSSGGNMVIAMGTGTVGSSSTEAAAWNPLTSLYGLTVGDVWFPLPGIRNEPVSGGVFASDVSAVRWDYGHEVFASGHAEIALRGAFAGEAQANAGIVGVVQTAVIPLPAGVWLLATGLGGLVALRRSNGRA